jgi:hypothetical protein
LALKPLQVRRHLQLLPQAIIPTAIEPLPKVCLKPPPTTCCRRRRRRCLQEFELLEAVDR